MFTGKIIQHVLTEREAIVPDRSRCMPLRLNTAECDICAGQCRQGAVELDEDVRIKAGACSECMLCVAACPSDCLTSPQVDFLSLLGRLRKLPLNVARPVIGCKTAKSRKRHHESTVCFGFLSKEHLAAMSVLLTSPVQIDAAECAGCRNGFIVAVLEQRIAELDAETSLGAAQKINVVKTRAELDFRAVAYDRRGFFKALKSATFLHASELVDSDNDRDETPVYSAKKLPQKRELLNRVLRATSGDQRRALLRYYYVNLSVDNTCTGCFVCTALCPTGALTIGDNGGVRTLSFSSALCVGCGLCKSFCSTNSISLPRGFSGEDPFEFRALVERPSR